MLSDTAKMTPEPSAPIQTPLPNIHLVPPALPPTRYTRAHTQPNFFFLLFFSTIFALFLISMQCAAGLFRFASRTGPPCWGEAKKAEKNMGWRGWMVKQRMARNRATPFASPVKSCFCVSFQRQCSVTAPMLAVETVPLYERKAFKDYAALLLLCWLVKWCHSMTGLCHISFSEMVSQYLYVC